jgi:pyruvate/2-oxoglutarate dehydrogenase complex dihydrolipoamide dehydrogenase (E3) component
VANTEGYGLEALGIPLAKTKTVEVNEYLQTLYPNIFACGDVAARTSSRTRRRTWPGTPP